MAQHTTTDVHGLSRLFHVIDAITSRAVSSAVVIVAVVASLALISVTGFSSEPQYIFITATAAITLVMVFVIQHTQSRQQLALQIKLDEIIRAIGRAQNIYLDLENRSQEELDEIKSQFEALAAKARARQVNAHMDVPK